MPYPMYCTFCGCIKPFGIIAKVTSISAFEKCKMYLVAGRIAWYQIAGWPAGLHGCVHLMACTRTRSRTRTPQPAALAFAPVLRLYLPRYFTRTALQFPYTR